LLKFAHGRHRFVSWFREARKRFAILALDALAGAAEVGSPNALAKAHREWVEDALASEAFQRNDAWTKSLAAGSPAFVLQTQEMLGARGKGRDLVGIGGSFVVREGQEIYEANSALKNRPIGSDNAYLWNVFP
jgi:putative transposase